MLAGEYFARLSYRPVPGDLKSGIPAEVEIPAPAITMTFGFFLSFFLSCFKASVKPARDESLRTESLGNRSFSSSEFGSQRFVGSLRDGGVPV